MKKAMLLFLALSMCAGLFGCGIFHAGSPEKKLDARWAFAAGDRRKTPFTKIVFAGDAIGQWTQRLSSELASYQMALVETVQTAVDAQAILQEQGDLIILADGVTQLLAGIHPVDYAQTLDNLIEELKAGVTDDAVILVAGIPYIRETAMGEITPETVAWYNGSIRAVAMGQNVLYANLYGAQGMRGWTLCADGITPNETGNMLLSGQVLQVLLKHCSCLAVNTKKEISYTMRPIQAPDENALQMFKTAATGQELRTLLESETIGADLMLYKALANNDQLAVCDALASRDRSEVGNYLDADIMINAAVMERLCRANSQSSMNDRALTYVAVGDSISYGSGGVNPKTDGYVPLLAQMIGQAQGQKVILVNLAISGTRMSTSHNNGQYDAAKDTPERYIVAKNPDIVTIAYGINDLNAGTSLETFISDYRGYLKTVTQGCPNTLVIVLGLCWEGRDPAGDRDVCEWNKAVKLLAEEFGVIYCDTYKSMYGSDWLLADGLHPSNAGHCVMANTVFRTLSMHVNFDAIR